MIRPGSLASLLAMAAAVAGAGLPAQSRACGPAEPPYWTFAGSFPADGQLDLLLDGALLLRGEPWIHPPAGPGFEANSLRWKVVDASGAEVPGGRVEWYGETWVLAWHPLAPLLPQQTYVLEASLDQGPLPAGVEGPTTLRATFTTGERTAPPLLLTGALAVELEAFDAEVLDCQEGSCGPYGCTPAGTRRALRANVTLPALSGGFDVDGYRAWLWLGGAGPQSFSGPGEGRSPGWAEVNSGTYVILEPGVLQVVQVELPEATDPYTPCFSFNGWDPAGNSASAAPLCLDALRPSEYLAGLDADGAGGSAGPDDGAPPGDSGPDEPGAAGGCAVSSPDPGPGSSLLLGLALVGLWGTRRRR